jgi:hypothetical protein
VLGELFGELGEFLLGQVLEEFSKTTVVSGFTGGTRQAQAKAGAKKKKKRICRE